MRGISPAQGIAQLAAAQAKLTNPDKSVRKNSFKMLMKQSGLTAQDLAEDGQQVSEQKDNPVINQLQEKIQQLESYIGSQQATNEQAQVKPIIDELESVRQEIDQASGDYRYPELHNEVFLQQTVKPLVSAIKGSVAGISWADALRKAYEISTGRKPAESFTSNQTRLHAAAMKPQTRAIAPVSVRGKSISSASTLDNNEPPPEALMDARATTAWALNQLRTRR
jgi:TolA-binding protein